MKKNMGLADRVIRVLLAVIFASLYLAGIIPGTLGLVLTALAVIFLLTSLFSVCPIYSIFGWTTCPVGSHKASKKMAA
ncbi:MAG: DUF2892 domain-containing protein [Cyclobacteriaceae bacterium]